MHVRDLPTKNDSLPLYTLKPPCIKEEDVHKMMKEDDYKWERKYYELFKVYEIENIQVYVPE